MLYGTLETNMLWTIFYSNARLTASAGIFHRELTPPPYTEDKKRPRVSSYMLLPTPRALSPAPIPPQQHNPQYPTLRSSFIHLDPQLSRTMDSPLRETVFL